MSASDVRAGAVILAAGRGERMGSDLNKVYLPLAGEPVIYHSLSKFLEHDLVGKIVVVINVEDREDYLRLKDKYDLSALKTAEGGAKRQDSSLAGVEKIESDYLLVHDAARPNFSPAILDRLLEAGMKKGAAIPGVKPVDTIREVRGEGAGETISRESLIKCQTPQCFRSSELLEALREADRKGSYFTDDAGASYDYTGKEPIVVEGDERNVKLTRPHDMNLLETYLD